MVPSFCSSAPYSSSTLSLRKINPAVHDLGHKNDGGGRGHNGMASTLSQLKKIFFPLLHLFPCSTSWKQMGLTVWLRGLQDSRDSAGAKTEHVPYSSSRVFISPPLCLLWKFSKIIKLPGKNFRARIAKWATTLIRAKLYVEASDSIGWNAVMPHPTSNFVMPHMQMEPARRREASARSWKHRNSSQGSRL